MKDSMGTEVQVGDTVAYIVSGYQNSAALKRGVVIKVLPKTFRVQPLYSVKVVDTVNRYTNGYKMPDGRYLSVGRTVIVKPSRLAVVNGEDWPEYQQFLDLGIVPEPLDSLA